MNSDDWPPIGSWWQENYKGELGARKQVIAHNVSYDLVQLKGARTTWAQRRRFNGKKGGYRRVSSTS